MIIPTRKISETILEFGGPVIEELPENPTEEDFHGTMRIIVSAWNAVVLDEWNNSNKFQKRFLNALRSMPAPFQDVSRELIERKKARYCTDPRAVGNYWIIEKNGEFVFRAEARLDLNRIEAIGIEQ